MTCDTWRMTHDMWHMTCDIWFEMKILLKFQGPSSIGLEVEVFEDILGKG